MAIKLIVDEVESSTVKSAFELIYTGRTKTDAPKSVASFLTSLGIKIDNVETEEIETVRQNSNSELDRQPESDIGETVDKSRQEAKLDEQKNKNLKLKTHPNSRLETDRTNPDLERSISEQNVFSSESELESDLNDRTNLEENSDQEMNSDVPVGSNLKGETSEDIEMVKIS